MSNYIELDNDVVQATCTICGYVFTFNARNLTGRAFDASLCKDCKAKPVRSVTKNGFLCTPHQGEFDLDTDQPLKNGKPFMPGFRKCGNADCVKSTHVITVEAMTAERFSIEYRTNERRNYKQLLAAVKKEGRND